MDQKTINEMIREAGMLPSKQEAEAINRRISTFSTFEKLLFSISRPAAILEDGWNERRYKVQRLAQQPRALLEKIGCLDPEHVLRAEAMLCGMHPHMTVSPAWEGGIFNYPTDPITAYGEFQDLYPKLSELPYTTPAGALAAMGIKSSAIAGAVKFSVEWLELFQDPYANLGKPRPMVLSDNVLGYELYHVGAEWLSAGDVNNPANKAGVMMGRWLRNELSALLQVYRDDWIHHLAIAQVLGELFNNYPFPKLFYAPNPWVAGSTHDTSPCIGVSFNNAPEVRVYFPTISVWPFSIASKLKNRVKESMMQQAPLAA